jgi:hypothetical protein
MTIFGPRDVGRHRPPAGRGCTYRESWWLQWHDADSGSSGVVCLQIGDGDTDGDNATGSGYGTARVRTSVCFEGEVTTKASTAPMDEPAAAEVAGFDLAGLRVRTVEPLRSFSVTVGETVELLFESGIDPIRFSLSGQRIALERDFYESVGRVTGRVRQGGRTVEIAAPAFHRHAWGVLTGGVHRVQAAWGVFGDDMFFSLAEYDSPTGRHPLGYLFAAEEFHGVEKVRFRTELDQHGVARSCDLLFATADRRDFRIPGEVVSGTEPGGPAFVTFQLAGRQGAGVLQAHAG